MSCKSPCIPFCCAFHSIFSFFFFGCTITGALNIVCNLFYRTLSYLLIVLYM